MKLNTVVVFALLFLSSYEGVKAGLNSTPKGVVITCLGATAVFNCTYGEDDGFPHFELNDSNSIQYTNDGVKFSDVSGSYMMNLSVPGDQKFNNTYVWCASQSNRSGPSLLIIQGSPSAPIIINVTCFNDSILLLHLSPPSDVRDQSLLTYNVTMVFPNGTLLHQTIIPPQQSSIVMKGCTHCHPCTIHVQPLCDTTAGEKATTAFNYSDPVCATNPNNEDKSTQDICFASTDLANTTTVAPRTDRYRPGHGGAGFIVGIIIGIIFIAVVIVVIGIIVIIAVGIKRITQMSWTPTLNRLELKEAKNVEETSASSPARLPGDETYDRPQQATGGTMPGHSCQRDVKFTDAVHPVLHNHVVFVNNELAESNLGSAQHCSKFVEKSLGPALAQPNSKEGTGDQSRPTMKKCSDSADNRDAIQSDDHQSCNDLDFKPGKASPPALETEFNDNYSITSAVEASLNQENPNTNQGPRSHFISGTEASSVTSAQITL